jgi:hypothetical protein
LVLGNCFCHEHRIRSLLSHRGKSDTLRKI